MASPTNIAFKLLREQCLRRPLTQSFPKAIDTTYSPHRICRDGNGWNNSNVRCLALQELAFYGYGHGCGRLLIIGRCGELHFGMNLLGPFGPGRRDRFNTFLHIKQLYINITDIAAAEVERLKDQCSLLVIYS
jgi:hypothetical protein